MLSYSDSLQARRVGLLCVRHLHNILGRQFLRRLRYLGFDSHKSPAAHAYSLSRS